ncbi:hypothetical protein LJC32_00315 [Oscillospiraceae bacterium OttesenSCG-928-F05]|nr:hypothetical protein [Oscillospiraceae bacterium OttesenSCG-928-F05]
MKNEKVTITGWDLAGREGTAPAAINGSGEGRRETAFSSLAFLKGKGV